MLNEPRLDGVVRHNAHHPTKIPTKTKNKTTMGRVSRYKKVKSCYKANDGVNFGEWGFGDNGQRVKKKSLTVQRIKQREAQRRPPAGGAAAASGRRGGGRTTGTTEGPPPLTPVFDAPPVDVEDEFDLTTFQVQKESVDEDNHGKNHNKMMLDNNNKKDAISDPAAVVPGTTSSMVLSNSVEEHKLFKKFEKDLEANKKPSQPEKPKGAKKEGESKSAYRRRAGKEVQQIILESRNSGQGKKAGGGAVTVVMSKTKRKTKKVLTAKKLKKKGQRDDVQAVAQQKKNKQLWPVEAALERRGRDTQVKFGEQAERPPVFQQLPRGADPHRNSHKTTSSNDVALETLRVKAQAQYALIKAQRKRTGQTFHL
jgi:hypothetical protein